MKLVFATNNRHKLEEVRSAVSNEIEILSLSDIGFEGEIPETNPTIEQNAIQKAFYIHERYGIPCFADDTGLLIDVLKGEPGVYSARYAGPNCSFKDNCEKVLSELESESNRQAHFLTVIAFIDGNKTHTFEGRVYGTILRDYQGEGGFGYDPIFLPEGFEKSFAEMDMDEKNHISHRGIATRKLLDFLKQK